ncbi:membrane protein [Streptomyces phage Dennebes]|nr:membrane protein [Streptomyces phage Dennebes]
METSDIIGLCIVSFLGGVVTWMWISLLMERAIERRISAKSES